MTGSLTTEIIFDLPICSFSPAFHLSLRSLLFGFVG